MSSFIGLIGLVILVAIAAYVIADIFTNDDPWGHQ